MRHTCARTRVLTRNWPAGKGTQSPRQPAGAPPPGLCSFASRGHLISQSILGVGGWVPATVEFSGGGWVGRPSSSSPSTQNYQSNRPIHSEFGAGWVGGSRKIASFCGVGGWVVTATGRVSVPTKQKNETLITRITGVHACSHNPHVIGDDHTGS